MLLHARPYIYKTISLLAIISLILCFMNVVSAIDVTFEPNRIFISGDEGATITGILNITNNNNASVELDILTDATGLVFFPSSVTIEANESVEVNVLYILQTNVTYGNITFEWQGSNIKAEVVIDEGGGVVIPPPVQAPVEIFPASPKSGSNVAIYFTEESAGLDANGFLHVNGFIYRVEMKDGFGIVELEKDAYGHATLYLFGSAIEEGDSTKEFEIIKGTGKDLRASVTATAKIDDSVSVTVSYGGEPYGNQEVMVTSPSDEVSTYTSDNQGKVDFKVDEIGKWRVKVSSEGQTATGSIDVDYGLLLLGIVEEEPPQVGDSITITTEPEAYVEVLVDGISEGDYIASADGFIPISITKGGRYALEGKLGNLRGKYSFQVPSRVNINILNPTTRNPVNKVENGKRYIVEITNSKGNLIEDVESVWIANPLGTKELLPLVGGVGTWNTYQTGSYMLSVDDTATYAGNSRYVLIKPMSGEFGWLNGLMIVCLSILALLIILVVYSRKRKIPFKLLLSSTLGSIFSKKNKGLDLPIG